ncbi:MAG: hypothetical protein ABSD29_25375, partial [Verrucomicrobiota bacterium]
CGQSEDSWVARGKLVQFRAGLACITAFVAADGSRRKFPHQPECADTVSAIRASCEVFTF